MNAPPPRRPKTRAPRLHRHQVMITVAVLAVFSLAVLLVLLRPRPPQQENQAAAKGLAVKTDAKSNPNTSRREGDSDTQLIDDNGRTLWASPTSGEPIELSYLPPGCSLIVHVRPADLVGAQGDAWLRALGPRGAQLVASLTEVTGFGLSEIGELLVGVRGGANNSLEVALVVRLLSKTSTAMESPHPPSAYQGSPRETYQVESYWEREKWCCYAPRIEQGGAYIFATKAVLHEIIDAAGEPPPLRREIESLAARSDASRQLTILASPSFLFTDGRALFAGTTKPLKDATFEFLPDSVKAASLSVHQGELFYWELRAAAVPEAPATRLTEQLKGRLLEWPRRVDLAVIDMHVAPYGKRLVTQLPAMLSLADEYARAGVVDDTAVLNGYLPINAGENLFAASELMLAQLSATAGTTTPLVTTNTAGPDAAEIPAKLRQRVSVVFTRDTLEVALQTLSEEIDVPIELLGRDLQLEGITRNQSFGMDAANLPAGEVLLKILLKANPDRTATGPQDPKQKLVYVINQTAARPRIQVTTRAAAAKRGDPLPSVFSGPRG